MRRNHAPRALNHELHNECAGDQHGNARCVRPDRNGEDGQHQRDDNRAAPADSIGNVTEDDATGDRADHREGRQRGPILRCESPIALQERWVHVLRPVRYEVHHRHQRDEIQKDLPIRNDRPTELAPAHKRVAVLERLRTTYPGCHVFSVDGFVGASPELLVSRRGDIVRSHPLAGTAPRGGDPTDDARTRLVPSCATACRGRSTPLPQVSS